MEKKPLLQVPLLPRALKKRVKGLFSLKGEKWLEDVPEILYSCIEKWEIQCCTISRRPSSNFICSGISPYYKEVILKIGVPHRELFTEMEALPLFREGTICQCYETDREKGALLLERILPGRDLLSLQDEKRRVEIGGEFLSHFSVALQREYTHTFPHYQELLKKTFKRAKEEGRIEKRLRPLLDRGEEMMEILLQEDRGPYLLHGDLHHFNLLEGQKGQWIAIDPKGILGPLVMEVGPFIKNELLLIEGGDSMRVERLQMMIEIFSRALHREERTIAYASMVYILLSTCWYYEESYPVQEEIERVSHLCHLIYTYTLTREKKTSSHFS